MTTMPITVATWQHASLTPAAATTAARARAAATYESRSIVSHLLRLLVGAPGMGTRARAITALLLIATAAAAAQEEWQPLREAIDAFADVPDTYVQIGDASGPRFAYQKGDTGPDSLMPVASATKWLGNVALFVLVEEGSLSLDDRVSRHIDWWTNDPDDLRSLITLRHCMSFSQPDTLAADTAAPI